MKRLLLVSACLMFLFWPSHEAAAQHRDFRGGYHGGYSRGYLYRDGYRYSDRRYGPMRRSYDAYGITPYGFIGLVPQQSGYGTYGNRPAGPYTICTAGRVEDMPVEEQVFWHDGETTYGPKYAGQRCIHQQ
jgi:hypothetical protein